MNSLHRAKVFNILAWTKGMGKQEYNDETADILYIQYADLGSDSIQRLGLLSAIGKLLGKSVGFHTPYVLGLTPDTWLSLRNWIEQGHGKKFWQVESQGVKVIQPWEKHILVGTAQLLSDLADVMKKLVKYQEHRINSVWLIAQDYAETKIAGDQIDQ